MRRGRPTPPLILTDDERQKLLTWSRRPTTAQRLALRARIVLACAEGLDQQQVAAQLRISRFTVGKWLARFLDDRLAGLADEPRPGAPRKLTDDRVEAVVTRTLETKPVAGPTGAIAAWRRPWGCPARRSAASGAPSS